MFVDIHALVYAWMKLLYWATHDAKCILLSFRESSRSATKGIFIALSLLDPIPTHSPDHTREKQISPPSFTDTLTQLPTSSCILCFSHLLMPVYFLLTTSCHSCMYVFLRFISHKLRPVAPSNASLCRCMYNNVILSSLWCQMLSLFLLLLMMIIVQIQ